MRLADQFQQVGVGAEAWIHLVEVDDIITTVRPARHIDRVQPDGRHADGADVIQAGDDARQVADAVAVAVLEGGRIDLIKDGVAQPGRVRRPGLEHAGDHFHHVLERHRHAFLAAVRKAIRFAAKVHPFILHQMFRTDQLPHQIPVRVLIFQFFCACCIQLPIILHSVHFLNIEPPVSLLSVHPYLFQICFRFTLYISLCTGAFPCCCSDFFVDIAVYS